MIKHFIWGLVLASALAAPAKQPDWHWYYYTLDKSPNSEGAKGWSRIRFDSKGDLKFVNHRGGKLMYGVFDWKSIASQVADTALSMEAQIAFTLDSKGNPHAIHHDPMYRNLYYAHHDGNNWTRFLADTINFRTTDFYQLSLEADSEDAIHMLYTTNVFNNGTNNLVYAAYDKALKRTERVLFDPLVGTGGKWNSLVFDRAGKPMIAHFVYDQSGLRVASKADTGWKSEIVLKRPGVAQEAFYASMQLTDTGTVRIVTHNRTEQQVQMASRGPSDSAWNFEKVDTLLNYSTFMTPANFRVGKGGAFFVLAPKVIYSGNQPVDCKLHLSYKLDSVWESQTVDTAGFVGLFSDMTLTPEGLPAISYYDWNNNLVKLAVARTTAPTDTNSNGIPDYQETPIEIVSVKKGLRPALPAAGRRRYDAMGRKADARRRASGPAVIFATGKEGGGRPTLIPKD